MAKKVKSGNSGRLKVPVKIQKELFKESQNKCPFCGEKDVRVLQIHHIIPVSEGGTDKIENLICACPTCHNKMDQGIITGAKVMTTKSTLQRDNHAKAPKRERSNVISFSKSNVTNNIIANKIIFEGKKKPTSVPHQLGTIGADSDKHNYIYYLIQKYHEWREKGKYYGDHRYNDKYSHAAIHVTIAKKFGAQTYYNPVERFEDISIFLQNKIDNTTFGRNQRKKGIRNYKSFREYIEQSHKK